MQQQPSISQFLAIAVAFIATGCGRQGLERYALSGKVTYGGQPVPAGEIIFRPDASRDNRGPGSQSDITGGRYQVSAAQGVLGGPYVVTISGYDGKPITVGGELVPAGSPLFEQKRLQVELPKSEGVKDFEIAKP